VEVVDEGGGEKIRRQKRSSRQEVVIKEVKVRRIGRRLERRWRQSKIVGKTEKKSVENVR
jgi:hypothetical protein